MEEIRFDEGELFVLAALQVMMLDRDLAAEKRPSATKLKTRDEAFSTATDMLGRFTSESPAWVCNFAAKRRTSLIEAVASAPNELGRFVDDREHAVSLLIELLLFDPWQSEKADWVTKQRTQSLREAAAVLPALRDNDLEVMEREYRAVTRRLRRAFAVRGFSDPGPIAGIGPAKWSFMVGLGGVVVTAGARYAMWSPDEVVIDAIKLDLYTRMVLSEDDEKARRVVETLHQRISELAQIAEQLKQRIQSLSEDNAKLAAENEELRRRLQREYEDTQRTETALEIVAKRLSGAGDEEAA